MVNILAQLLLQHVRLFAAAGDSTEMRTLIFRLETGGISFRSFVLFLICAFWQSWGVRST